MLLSQDGPRLIDFGIARAADATQLTTTGGLIGTPHFMSPEQALGDPVGPAGDLFALGLVAAVEATGRHPYGDGGAITVATQIANTAIRPPDLSGYPDALRPLLERCLTASPDERITPAEVVAQCEQAAPRPLNDFNNWLPHDLTSSIDRRATEADRLLRSQRSAAPQLPPMPASEPPRTLRVMPHTTEPPRRTGKWVWGAAVAAVAVGLLALGPVIADHLGSGGADGPTGSDNDSESPAIPSG